MIRKIHMIDFLLCITNTCDLMSNELTDHHKKVAYLAFRIAESFGLTVEQQREIFMASVLHDIGAFSANERMELNKYEPDDVNDHAFIGADILESFKPLEEVSKIIRYHHIPWNDSQGSKYDNDDVPIASHIIHLADRIVINIDNNKEIIGQINDLVDLAKRNSGSIFAPQLVEAFINISDKEYIWLDITYKSLKDVIFNITNFDIVEIDIDDVIELSKVFANVIDFRSPFTANHSFGVAAVAQELSHLAGFSENERKMMLVAGYLHDLGKLAVDKDILEKPTKLSLYEHNVIRSHTFYTYRILQSIKGFETINIWASYHHERLSGNGYPFHLSSKDIPLGARLMAIADIFTALTEERPYRTSMEKDRVIDIMQSLADNNSICSYSLSILLDNYDMIDEKRKLAQEFAKEKYNYINITHKKEGKI